METPESSKNELLNKQGPTIEDDDPYFKIAKPKPIESEIVFIEKSNFNLCVFFSVSIFVIIPFGLLLLFPLILIPILVLIVLCIYKKYYILQKDKDNNTLNVYEKNCLCCKWKLLEVPLKDAKIECLKAGGIDCCFGTKTITNVRIYCTDQARCDLDNSNVQNVPTPCLYILKNCIGFPEELESKILGLSVEKHKNEISDELAEGYKNGMKKHKSKFYHVNYPVRPEILNISKYYYIFRNFDIYEYDIDGSRMRKETFEEIDWIYSKNFDRIFIGILKNKNTYLNKRIFEIESIDNFHFEIMDKFHNFQVSLKNGDSMNLCTFHYLPDDILNDFIVLLNWQIIKIKGKNGQNFNSENENENDNDNKITITDN